MPSIVRLKDMTSHHRRHRLDSIREHLLVKATQHRIQSQPLTAYPNSPCCPFASLIAMNCEGQVSSESKHTRGSVPLFFLPWYFLTRYKHPTPLIYKIARHLSALNGFGRPYILFAYSRRS